MSHVFFSNDVMDESAYQESKRAFRPCLWTGSCQICRWKHHDVGSNYVLQPQNKPSTCPRIFNVSTLKRRYLAGTYAQCYWPTEINVSAGQCPAPYNNGNHRFSNNINVLPWPSNSPDLNPIEHLWDEFDRLVRQRQAPAKSLNQLSQALLHEWQRLPRVLREKNGFDPCQGDAEQC